MQTIDPPLCDDVAQVKNLLAELDEPFESDTVDEISYLRELVDHAKKIVEKIGNNKISKLAVQLEALGLNKQ